MPSLRSIVYVSTAIEALSIETLEGLLVDAREFNKEAGVTGVLLYSKGTFMQCFEGAEEGVADVYRRIRESRLHWSIRELMNGPIDKRAFKDWQMGFAEPSKSDLLTLWTAGWERQLLWSHGWSVPRGMQLLQLFWSRAA